MYKGVLGVNNMDISDEELKKAILNSAPVPPCPSDKFVNSFISQMDKDLAANNNFKISNLTLKAAAFVMVLFGLSYANRDFIGSALVENSVRSNITYNNTASDSKNTSNGMKKAIVSNSGPLDIYYNNYANQYIDSYYNSGVSGQDAFVSQAIGYEDITQIVHIKDM